MQMRHLLLNVSLSFYFFCVVHCVVISVDENNQYKVCVCEILTPEKAVKHSAKELY